MLITLEQAAEQLQLSKRTITRYIQSGKLIAVPFGTKGMGRRWRIEQKEIEAFIQRQKEEALND